MRTFSRLPMAISASRIPFSIPLTSADIATRLDTPRMIPSIVRSERNLCAQISLKPMLMAFRKFILVVLNGARQPRVDLTGNFAVADFNSPRSARGNFRIVGHQRNGAALRAQLLEQA